MTARRFTRFADALSQRAGRRALPERVIVTGTSTATGQTIVHRDARTGRYTTRRSARAIDRTVSRFGDALERLAKK